ncbi:MAG: hypothetical protein LUG99_21405 [Lachnospiraceae bacterium]|nr:hypothetical protein [Lachnospiraceae bacterium]
MHEKVVKSLPGELIISEAGSGISDDRQNGYFYRQMIHKEKHCYVLNNKSEIGGGYRAL